MFQQLMSDIRGHTVYFQDFCKALDVPLYMEDVEVDFTRKPAKQPCFICSWARRKKIFNKAKEINCNKIALGHHYDDALKTMLMNMIYHGSFSSMQEAFHVRRPHKPDPSVTYGP